MAEITFRRLKTPLLVLASLIIGIIIGRNLVYYYASEQNREVSDFVGDLREYTLELQEVNNLLGDSIRLIAGTFTPQCEQDQECVKDALEAAGNIDGQIKVRMETMGKLRERINQKYSKIWLKGSETDLFKASETGVN